MTSNWKHDRRSRQDRGYGAAWDKLRKSVMERDLWLCQPCKRTGRDTPAKECDHIKPKSKGGTNDPSNLQAICTPCHAAKTTQEAADAQGRTVKPVRKVGPDGYPIE